jgi:glycosyltransferase involved in cell wall biosynthesis
MQRLKSRLAIWCRLVLPRILEALASRLRDGAKISPVLLAGEIARRLGPYLGRPNRSTSTLRPSPAVLDSTEALLKKLSTTEPELARFVGGALANIPVFPVPDLPRARAWTRLQSNLAAPCRRLILVPWLRYGDADRVALNALRAAQAQDGVENTLLLVTDTASLQAHAWLPEGTRIAVLGEEKERLTREDRVVLLVAMLHRLRPIAVLNVNSRAGWDALQRHGPALGALTRLSAYVFCEDYNSNGQSVDYTYHYLRAALPYLAAVYSDHSGFLFGWARDHHLAPEWCYRLRQVPQPHPLISGAPPGGMAGGGRVLWVGRITPQMAPDLLPPVAAALPEMSFEMHGVGEVNELRALRRRAPANLLYRGEFAEFMALRPEGFLALLYTTRFDGLPNTLLEAGAAGLPIVAARRGGISELITDETGWPVDNPEDPAAYARALRAIRADPVEAARRALRLRKVLCTRHAPAAHDAALRAAPGFLSEEELRC